MPANSEILAKDFSWEEVEILSTKIMFMRWPILNIDLHIIDEVKVMLYIWLYQIVKKILFYSIKINSAHEIK